MPVTAGSIEGKIDDLYQFAEAADLRNQRVEQKLDTLARQVDRRFDTVDNRLGRLETDVAEVKTDVASLKGDMKKVLELLQSR